MSLQELKVSVNNKHHKFFLIFYSPLGKLAGRVIYFADVFALFKKKFKNNTF